MIQAKYNQYPKYKNSSVEWVAECPAGWEERRFCFLFSFTKGLSITKDDLQDEGVPCVNYGEIHSKYGFEVDPKIHPLKCVRIDYLQSNPKSLLKQGDFIFADTSEDIDGSGNFTYLNSHEATFAGYHTIITKPKVAFSFRYVAYLFDSRCFRTQIRSEVSGIKVFSITKTILKDTIVTLPPLPEQKAIASFLDCETARIDGIIAKQTRMIELLKEKRSALITQAVTKGLDPKAKMKKSGVEWIGEIPEGWEARKVKFLVAKTIGGGTPSTGNKAYWEGDIPWVSPKDMKVDKIADTEDHVTEKALAETNVTIVPVNNLLGVLRSGILKHTFPVAINDVEVTLNQDMKAFLPNALTNTEYLFWLFNGLNKHILNLTVKAVATVESVENKYLFNIYMPLPPQASQKCIVDFLKRETTHIDGLVGKIETQITLLNEYKQSLITHAVTGKIDVRELA